MADDDQEAEAQAAAATRIGSMYRGKKTREEHKRRVARHRETPAHRRREARPLSVSQLPSMKGQVIERAERVLSELQLADARNEAAQEEHVETLRGAQALIFLTQLRSGGALASSAAVGFMIRRLADGKGWSAPSSLGCTGTGMKAPVGARSTDIVIACATDVAVNSLVSSGTLLLEPPASGSEAGSSAAHASLPAVEEAPYTAFARGSNGRFRPLGVEDWKGVKLESRQEDNLAFYGRSGDTAAEVLGGRVRPPSESVELYTLLVLGFQPTTVASHMGLHSAAC